MKKKNVLKKNHQFQYVIKKKRSLNNKYLVIYYYPNKLELNRYGISISKKFANAVMRNYYRRKVRMILSDVDSNHSVDMVIIVRKPFLDLKHKDMEEQLLKLMKKVENEL